MAWTAFLAALAIAGAMRHQELESGSASAAVQLRQMQLEAEELQNAAWWVRDGAFAYAPGAGDQDISNYFYALGAASASKELRKRRVGGSGRVHIFHLPPGLRAKVPMDGVSGPRSSALSELASLEHGETLQELPPYQMPATFQEPLSAAGLAKEQEMMSGLTQEIYQKYLDGLTDFPSRSLFLSNERQEKLLSFLKRKFKNMGYSDEQICVHTSSAKGLPPVHNVVVFIPGSAPGTVTMGAHYDSIPPRGEAPGAVDNGSGSAAVLAMARAWKEANVTPRKSLYFALFGGEEEGLWGSDAFAEALRSENSSNPLPPKCRPSAGGRHAAITMDMIGWRNPRFPADTVTMETKRWASGFFPLLAQSNNVNNRGNLKLLYSLKPYGSDHESFLNRGMPAILLIDNDGDAEAYPCYHKACDEKSNVDARLATEICKMNLGAFLRIARVQ